MRSRPGVSFTVDRAELAAMSRELTSAILLAGTRSVRDATRQLEREFERLTKIGVPGEKAWRAWASDVYPKTEIPAYDPVGEIYGKGGSRTQGMLTFWTAPGTVRPLRGDYLAVPLKAALGTYAGKKITPRHWEGIFKTKLRPFRSKTGQLLLVADGTIDGRGHYLSAERGAAKRRGGQQVSKRITVPVFALIPEFPHANTVSLGGAYSQAQQYLARTLVRRLARI